MKVRWTRIALVGLVFYLFPGLFGWWRIWQSSLDAQQPDLSRSLGSIRNYAPPSRSFSQDNGQKKTLEWTNRQGSMMGTVSARVWKARGRIYCEVSGPFSPDATTDETPLEVIYKTKHGVRIEKYGIQSASVQWKTRPSVTGSMPLPLTRYSTEIDSGRFRARFWTSQSEPIGNLVYHYRESPEETAWVAMDCDGTNDHYDPEQWTVLKGDGAVR